MRTSLLRFRVAYNPQSLSNRPPRNPTSIVLVTQLLNSANARFRFLVCVVEDCALLAKCNMQNLF